MINHSQNVPNGMKTSLRRQNISPWQLKGRLEYEPPNSFLQFSGNASVDEGEKFPIEFSSLVLRGSIIRNTPWVGCIATIKAKLKAKTYFPRLRAL